MPGPCPGKVTEQFTLGNIVYFVLKFWEHLVGKLYHIIRHFIAADEEKEFLSIMLALQILAATLKVVDDYTFQP